LRCCSFLYFFLIFVAGGLYASAEHVRMDPSLPARLVDLRPAALL
jgi:hypothetical protein